MKIDIPERGERPAFSIAYDIEADVLLVDGVKFSPEVLLGITQPEPDPKGWLRFRRKGDTVTAHFMMTEAPSR